MASVWLYTEKNYLTYRIIRKYVYEFLGVSSTTICKYVKAITWCRDASKNWRLVKVKDYERTEFSILWKIRKQTVNES